MKLKRTIIIPAILALSSVLGATAVSLAATSAPAAVAAAPAHSASPDTFAHG